MIGTPVLADAVGVALLRGGERFEVQVRWRASRETTSWGTTHSEAIAHEHMALAMEDPAIVSAWVQDRRDDRLVVLLQEFTLTGGEGVAVLRIVGGAVDADGRQVATVERCGR